ncbi:hypothetical protein COCCADRAFT_42125 [Bipolaris zeicola 26-R-13]|uniref:Lignostilbene-alpha,beta-dioxygenase isozyme III n=1 Tax=Cochliobolus carbonum (strain 26-R-13) TaxID=930089 RepID=W6XW43_COCC2|nr:uncharacterized protein COCCADRAFT_42125 [Bipolaris zeicola 26-R-13]EUC26999.1 hypothetical protein COCCADRAFT_42125 [Bipolaris zeicola 26-R-13]
MAHIFELSAVLDTGYVDRKKVDDRFKFPNTGIFSGINKPFRLEGDIFDLEVEGKIPLEINVLEDDIHFNGDGNITAIPIGNGHADYKQRYVRTYRFLAETSAGRSLFGRYRNPYTDSELVKSVIRTAANTNITFWRGMLLASKEDGPPYAMDPVSLETIGWYDFEGQITAPTMAAHPKFDPDTGEMICFAYEAGGDKNDGLRRIAVWTIDADGGGNHWVWDPKEHQWYSIVPRRMGKPEDIVWLRSGNAFHGHVAGCYENDQGNIVFDLTVADGNVFFFSTPDDEPTGSIFNPKSPSESWVEPSEVWNTSGRLSHIDDRYVTKKYNHFWQAKIGGAREYDVAKYSSPAGGLFNCLAHYTWDERKEDPSFIPKSDGAEGEGWLIALLNHLDVLHNDVVIFDALNLAKGPVATIRLPTKLRLGLHGNFVDQRDIEEWQARRQPSGDVGFVKPATKPLPWQLEAENP